MIDAAELRFLVQGSAEQPYRLRAYGIGVAFRLFCSCPAGSRAKKMCKHAAAILMGDVTKLVAPSDCIIELARRAEGSPVIGAALAHRPAVQPVIHTAPLDAGIGAGLPTALATVIAMTRQYGFIVQASHHKIGLHKLSKVKKMLKYPEVGISYTEEDVRPFAVWAKNGKCKCYGHLERAAAFFLELAEGNRVD